MCIVVIFLFIVVILRIFSIKSRIYENEEDQAQKIVVDMIQCDVMGWDECIKLPCMVYTRHKKQKGKEGGKG